ncbi:hypothetical protein ZYGR_0AI06790 [Zygosaccharomyces rouxii]|uniref:C2H2-type domain-containing protein n=1 Tax=Zygosaccharomyces rouxii TaxID=4956 RepID=A0A1Q3ACP7_ZYGRO|nr:hypothetical protein ZYGR_0AI06790 [Zygosaccharomyces rouxii]
MKKRFYGNTGMSKRGHEGNQSEDSYIPSGSTIVCQEPPCFLNHVPIELYNEHAQQYHEHRCEACHGNFVTEKLLEIHQEEFHNPFRQKSTLRCFEPDCIQEFNTENQRIDHLRNEHNYPETFDFYIIARGYTFE